MAGRWTGPIALRKNEGAAAHPRFGEYVARARKVAGDLENQLRLGGIWSGFRTVRIADDAIVQAQVIDNFGGSPQIQLRLIIAPSKKTPKTDPRSRVSTVVYLLHKTSNPIPHYVLSYVDEQFSKTPPPEEIRNGRNMWVDPSVASAGKVTTDGSSEGPLVISWINTLVYWRGAIRINVTDVIGFSSRVVGAICKNDMVYVVVSVFIAGQGVIRLYKGPVRELERTPDASAGEGGAFSLTLVAEADSDLEALPPAGNFSVSDDKQKAVFVRIATGSTISGPRLLYRSQETVVDFDEEKIYPEPTMQAEKAIDATNGHIYSSDFVIAADFIPGTHEITRLVIAFPEVLPGPNDLSSNAVPFGFHIESGKGDFLNDMVDPFSSEGFYKQESNTTGFVARYKITPEKHNFLPDDLYFSLFEPSTRKALWEWNGTIHSFLSQSCLDNFGVEVGVWGPGSEIHVNYSINYTVGAHEATRVDWVDLRNRRILVSRFKIPGVSMSHSGSESDSVEYNPFGGNSSRIEKEIEDVHNVEVELTSELITAKGVVREVTERVPVSYVVKHEGNFRASWGSGGMCFPKRGRFFVNSRVAEYELDFEYPINVFSPYRDLEMQVNLLNGASNTIMAGTRGDAVAVLRPRQTSNLGWSAQRRFVNMRTARIVNQEMADFPTADILTFAGEIVYFTEDSSISNSDIIEFGPEEQIGFLGAVEIDRTNT